MKVIAWLILLFALSPSIGLTVEASAMAAGQEGSDMETLVLSPIQVLGRSVEMEAHYTTHQGKKTLGFIRVRNVVKGSIADRAGLKKGDRIVAIRGWRLEGQELTALNRDFTTQLQDGEPTLKLAVRRPHHDEEREVILRYPQKKQSTKSAEPNRVAGSD